MATLTKGKTFVNGELVTPQKLHELVDLASITGIVTAEITDSAITTAKLAANSVTTAKIADANVTTAKLADSAVTSAKIADGTIVNADISASAAIALSKLATGALPSAITVASANIVDGTIVNGDISASAAIADTKLATISTAGKVSNSATTAASTNTANAIVTRDALGSFSANTITAALAGNATTATKLATARTISLTGAVTGSTTFDGSGNASIATTHTADPVITLTGDVTGSGTMTNLGSVSITATVADDSHNHVISNVDGLQAALDGKQAAGSYAPATGIAPSAIAGTAVITTDSRLSDARTPTAHTHGNITNAGAIGATANLPVVTTTSGVLTTIPAGSAGQVLTSNGGTSAPSFQTLAATTTNANNLTGGSAGTVPYQSAAGTTVMLAAGTSGQVLRSNGAAAPSWLTLGNSATLNTGTTSGTVATGNHTHSAATTSAAGFMPAADKAKLDTATSTNTANAIVTRSATGSFNANTITLQNAPTNNTSIILQPSDVSTGAAVIRISQQNGTTLKNYLEFRIGSTLIGSIVSASSSSVAYNTTSDYRLKTNLEPLTDAVARLLQIPVHRFNWVADPDAPKVDGFLAHEAQAIVPESVTGHKDEVDAEGNPVHQGIDQSKLVPLLVAAVQELAARVAALESAK